MDPSPKRILLAGVAMILMLGACIPAQPTEAPQDNSSEIATSVALTIAAHATQTAAAFPLPTNTPLPTQTAAEPPSPTPVLPTATPLVLPTVTPVPGGGGPTTRPEYACDTIRRRPFDNTVFRPNQEFEVRWTIVNTGTKTMRAGLDLKFHNGVQMGSITRTELPELKPGDQHQVGFDGRAPLQEGFHVMVFMVEGGLCYPYTVIKVEK